MLETLKLSKTLKSSRQFASGDARFYLFIYRLKPAVKLRNQWTTQVYYAYQQ